MTAQLDRIVSDTAVMGGQPCVRGTRLTVRRVLHLLSQYGDPAELSRDFPELTDEDRRQVLEFAAARIAEQEPVMVSDPILAEVRRVREELDRKFNGDVHAIFADLMERQKVPGPLHPLVRDAKEWARQQSQAGVAEKP